jgi:hypothetical protein
VKSTLCTEERLISANEERVAGNALYKEGNINDAKKKYDMVLPSSIFLSVSTSAVIYRVLLTFTSLMMNGGFSLWM